MEQKVNLAERIKMVKAMEFIARQINDEDIFDGWLMNGVADGDIDYGDTDGMDKDGMIEYYTSDKEFAELMDCFLRVISRARKSGGLYCNYVTSNEG